MYSLLRNILFTLDPEVSHELSLDMMSASERLKLIGILRPKINCKPVNLMGLEFSNPVGLAAGMDKNGDCLNALGALGFGFLELGTVTPVAQPGNPKPRLFRLKEQEAIINRMGFNNKGVDHLVQQVKQKRYQGVIGINIGKNKDTPEEQALSDYTACMDKVYTTADYIAVNISSPNTPGLRNLQFGETLNALIGGINEKRKALADQYGMQVPIAVKVAPDNDTEAFKAISDTLMKHEMDAVIATNTTIGRLGVESSKHAAEMGGLSGKPVRELSTEAIAHIKSCVGDDLPIIGVGGIYSAEDAQEKVDAGASLVQIYSGFIYKGPELIGDIANSLKFPSVN